MADDFFRLDKHALDEEWLRQPKLYHEYAIQLADARFHWEQARTELEILEAEIDRNIRLFPTKFGYEKTTEALIEKTIRLQPEWQKCNGVTLEAKHKMDVLIAAVGALEHRKKSLEDLVKLHLANYFSKPIEPKESDVSSMMADKSFRINKERRGTDA